MLVLMSDFVDNKKTSEQVLKVQSTMTSNSLQHQVLHIESLQILAACPDKLNKSLETSICLEAGYL